LAALLEPSTDFQVQLIAAVVDLGSLRDCQQAGLTRDHFSQWPDAWDFVERHNNQFGRTPTRQTLENRFPRLSFPKGQTGDIQFLIEEVRGQWLYDQMSELMEKTVQLMVAPDRTVQDALNFMQSESQLIQSRHGSSNRDTDLLREGRFQLLDQAVRRRAAMFDPSLKGLQTGFREFDRGGLDPEELVVVLARITQGKSWALLYMASQALLQGKKVLYFPLEMSLAQVGFRLHVILQSVYLQRNPELMKEIQPFLNRSLSDGSGYDFPSYKKFLELLETTVQGSFVVSETPGKLSPASVMAKIQEHRPDAVFIDYLTLMGSDSKSDLEGWQDIKIMMNSLKSIAQGQKVPIITAAQASRAAVSRKGPPELDDIAFGDAIGQDADRVISIKQLSRRVTKTLIIKNRHQDARTTSYLEHDWNRGKIREVDEGKALDLLQEDRDRDDLVSDRGLL
jgi:replicative DNA helicase